MQLAFSWNYSAVLWWQMLHIHSSYSWYRQTLMGCCLDPVVWGLSFHQGWLWPAKCHSGVFVQVRLGFCFCVFSCYSIVLLNVFQCANTGDVGMGSGGGGRKVWIWDRQNLQNFSPVDWAMHCPPYCMARMAHSWDCQMWFSQCLIQIFWKTFIPVFYTICSCISFCSILTFSVTLRGFYSPSSVMSYVISFPVVVPKELPSSLLMSHFPWEKVSGSRKLRGIGLGK